MGGKPQNLLNLTHGMISMSLADLLQVLGSPKKTKDALAALEVASSKADKAMKNLDKATKERNAKHDAEAKEREKQIDAIHQDQTALAAAWERLKDDTAVHNANHQEATKKLRADEQALKIGQAQLAKDNDDLKAARRGDDNRRRSDGIKLNELGEQVSAERKRADEAETRAANIESQANQRVASLREALG
jgi:hypothetical protein